MVIKLKQPFDLSIYVMPASLPTKPIEAGSKCYFSGWGNIKPRTTEENFTRITPDRLQYAKLEVANNKMCEKSYYNNTFNTLKDTLMHVPFLKEYEICTTFGIQDACAGDSGGPLMCEGMQKTAKSENRFIFKRLIACPSGPSIHTVFFTDTVWILFWDIEK
jgi:hypothetical protein